ncbi:hypothetical protein [Clostridium sp.]|uniref:hypothetical protein n=1 Tax=Clostridium sp. TaxID=1506 RepID=UPI002FC5ECBF
MSKHLIKTTEVYRVDTVSEVEVFHTDLKNDGNFVLDGFGYKQKQIKEKGEVVEEYNLVTVKKLFDDEKYPSHDVDITYNRA